MGDADVFCANCGRRQDSPTAGSRPSGQSTSAPPPFPGPPSDPLAGLTPRTASILCYIPTVGWIAAVVVLSSRKFKTDKLVRFHAFQGLYLFAAWLLVQWVIRPVMRAMPGHAFPLDNVLSVILLAVSVFMLIKARHNEHYVLPIIGELAQKSALEQ